MPHAARCPESIADLLIDPRRFASSGAERDKISQEKGMGIDINAIEFDVFLHSRRLPDATDDAGNPIGAAILALAISYAGLGASKWQTTR